MNALTSFPLTSFSKTLHPTTRDSDRCRNEHEVLGEAPPGRISAKESLKESLRRPQRVGSLYPSEEVALSLLPRSTTGLL